MKIIPKKKPLVPQNTTEKDLSVLLEIINRERGSRISQLVSNEKSYQEQLKTYKQYIKDYTAKLKTVKEEMAKTTDDRWKTEDLTKSLDMLNKNKNIDWAFLTKDRELIVQTKMLTRYDAHLEKKIDEPVGRYAFKINLSNYPTFSVFALDFETNGYRHPNIMSHPTGQCWGGYDSTLRKMFSTGEIYNGVDAMINFFSMFPHSTGSHKLVYWIIWLNEREIRFRANPWTKLEPVYVVGKITEPKEIKKIEIKRVETYKDPTLGEMAIRGLNFRSY